MAVRVIAIALGMTWVGANASWGQAILPDPTRPPAAVSKPAAGDEAGAAVGPRLQSVILPRDGRKPAAVIDGQRVELGGWYGGARLVVVTEERVVLDTAGNRQELRLTPEAAKRPRPARPDRRGDGPVR